MNWVLAANYFSGHPVLDRRALIQAVGKVVGKKRLEPDSGKQVLKIQELNRPLESAAGDTVMELR